MTTGARIKAARKAAGMTQAELANRLGIPYQSIGQWENDLRNPKLETLQKIASALGVPVVNLLSDDYLVPYEDVADAIKQDMINNAYSPEEYEEAINTSISDIQAQLLREDIRRKRLQKIAGYFDSMNETDQQKAMEHVAALAKDAAANVPDDAVSDVKTDDLAIFDRVCQITGHYVRPKLDDLSGYYLGKHGEGAADVFLSNKEFRALVKRIAAATAAMIDSEIEVAKDDTSPK